MSTPTTPDKNKSMRNIHQIAMTEVISAQSALNMVPDPIKDHGSESGYLSETDEWAKHSMEHLRNIFAWGRLMEGKIDRLEDVLFQLYKAGKMNSETLNTLLEIVKGLPTI